MLASNNTNPLPACGSPSSSLATDQGCQVNRTDISARSSVYEKEVCESIRWLLQDIAPRDDCICYAHNVPATLRRPIHFSPSVKQVFAEHFYRYKRERADDHFMLPCLVSPVDSEVVAFGYPQDWAGGFQIDFSQHQWARVLLEFDYSQTFPTRTPNSSDGTVANVGEPESCGCDPHNYEDAKTTASSNADSNLTETFKSGLVDTSPVEPANVCEAGNRCCMRLATRELQKLSVGGQHESSFLRYASKLKSPTSSLSRGSLRDPNSLQFVCGTYTTQGCRTYNEDKIKYVYPLEVPANANPQFKMGFFGVYDGHNGEASARFASDYLHEFIINNPHFSAGDHEKAAEEACLQCDKYIRGHVRRKFMNDCDETLELYGSYTYEKEYDDDVSNITSGSTACVCLFDGARYTIANLGDSRCVLSRNGHAVVLTRDHRLSCNDEEQARVTEAGATFDNDGYLGGTLSVSRGFGDFDKNTGEKLKGLSASPEVFQDVLVKEDEFMIIACDGVFDVMTNQEAVGCVHAFLKRYKDADVAAKALCETALKQKSLDNLTVLLVLFTGEDDCFSVGSYASPSGGTNSSNGTLVCNLRGNSEEFEKSDGSLSTRANMDSEGAACTAASIDNDNPTTPSLSSDSNSSKNTEQCEQESGPPRRRRHNFSQLKLIL